jgi:hypothetical protein
MSLSIVLGTCTRLQRRVLHALSSFAKLSVPSRRW